MTPNEISPERRSTPIVLRGIESVRAALRVTCGEVAIDVRGREEDVVWRINPVVVGPLAFLPNASVGRVGITFHPADYFVSMSRGRGGRTMARGVDATAERSSRAVVCSAGIPFEWSSGGAHEGLSIRIDARFLKRQLEAMMGESAPDPLEFSFVMSTEGGAGAALEQLCLFVAREAERGVLFEHPVLRSTLAETFTRALLLGQPHTYTHRLAAPAPRSSPRVVRLVEEYAEAFASEPIGLETIVALTGESGAAIDAAFRAYRGASLGDVIDARRLDRAKALSNARRSGERSSPRGPKRPAAPEVDPKVVVMGVSADNASLLASAARRAGHEVMVLDSKEALISAALAGRALAVLVDVRGREELGLEVLSLLADGSCPIPVVLVGEVGDGRAVVKAMKAGTMDYLFEPVADDVLAEVLGRAVAQGRLMRAWILERDVLEMKMRALTGREREVCERVARGMLNKQIAADLGISEARVKVHRAGGMAKLGVSSAAELGRLFGASERL